MIENRDILIFGEDWGRFPSTTQHIGKVLLERNRVMWVGSLGHRKPRLSFSDVKRIFEKIFKMIRPANQDSVATDQPSPIQVSSFWIPYHDWSVIRVLNRFFLKRKLRSELKKHGFRDVIVITSTPLVGHVIPELGVKSAHYLCLDDYSEFDGAFDALLVEEQILLQHVNVSFSISDILVNTRVPKNGFSHFITQGVDTSHFDRSRTVIPASLAGIKKPVIGFFGLISEWADLDLIRYSAQQLPEYSFVMVGKVTVDVSEFSTLDNVHFTGQVPYSELPSVASVFDVGSIPFKVNELTLACNPLKMFEYFSMGLPVVSTALPEVVKFSSHVYIANTREEYVSLLREAVESVDELNQVEKRALANRYSWHAVTEIISDRILQSEK